MQNIHPNRIGLVLALMVGGLHAIWSLIVAIGWGQALINFIFKVHFIKPVYEIEPFNISNALLLVLITASIGYAVGNGIALLWNKLRN
jgi:hypothetical protein